MIHSLLLCLALHSWLLSAMTTPSRRTAPGHNTEDDDATHTPDQTKAGCHLLSLAGDARRIIFVAFGHDKSMLVTTKRLSRQTHFSDKCVFVATKLLLQQKWSLWQLWPRVIFRLRSGRCRLLASHLYRSKVTPPARTSAPCSTSVQTPAYPLPWCPAFTQQWRQPAPSWWSCGRSSGAVPAADCRLCHGKRPGR